MKKIIAFMSVAFLAIAVNAQQSPMPVSGSKNPEAKPAEIKPVAAVVAPAVETLVLKEAEFDFGKIPQGKPVTHVFELINKGKDSLKIVNVQASCGCTTPEWDKDKAIAPGGTAKITVGYNAATEGVFTKPVTITYNGAETKQLFIKGEVWKTPALSAPENKSLGDLKN
jgi:Protein of unknown function (DUF1573)